MRHANGGKDQEGEQAEQHERADETELLDSRANTKSVWASGKSQRRPAMRCPRPAEEATRAHGDHGLQQVIAGTRYRTRGR